MARPQNLHGYEEAERSRRCQWELPPNCEILLEMKGRDTAYRGPWHIGGQPLLTTPGGRPVVKRPPNVKENEVCFILR